MNRETAAAVTAWNTGLVIFFAVLLFGLLNHPGARDAVPAIWDSVAELHDDPDAAVDEVAERGWAVYQAERCSSCHAIAGVGSPRYPLDGVADRWSSEELRLWVVDPQEVSPGVRKRAYDHLPDEDVEALVTFLGLLIEP
jgi:mono/diheme cytochrome c family protein